MVCTLAGQRWLSEKSQGEMEGKGGVREGNEIIVRIVHLSPQTCSS